MAGLKMADLGVLAVVALILTLCAFSLIRDRKKGVCSCSKSCANCAGCAACHAALAKKH